MKKYYVIIVLLSLMSGAYYLKARNLNLKKDELERPLVKNKINVTSDAFKHHGRIPASYTCDGEDAFPSLQFDQVPVDSKTLAIICDDPDAPKGLWVHWVAFNLPATITEVKASGDVLAHGGTVGTNSWDKQSWGGPCPPSGTHRYYFKVYALDTKLTLDKTARNTDLLRAMEGHIIGYGELMGLYAKKK